MGCAAPAPLPFGLDGHNTKPVVLCCVVRGAGGWRSRTEQRKRSARLEKSRGLPTWYMMTPVATCPWRKTNLLTPGFDCDCGCGCGYLQVERAYKIDPRIRRQKAAEREEKERAQVTQKRERRGAVAGTSTFEPINAPPCTSPRPRKPPPGKQQQRQQQQRRPPVRQPPPRPRPMRRRQQSKQRYWPKPHAGG